MKFDAWIQSIKLRGKWKLDAIAMSVFLIARHVHDHQKKLAMSGRASTDSKIIALVLMYRYYITEINRAELERQLQNAAAEKSLQQQQTTSKETKALPVNFCCDLSKVSFFVPDLFLSTGYFNGLVVVPCCFILTSRSLNSTVLLANVRGRSFS
jgi:hypothetical protein